VQILFLNKNFFLKNYKIFLLIFILFLIFYRSPYIFINGRFVAEEGSFWFRNAYLFGPIKGFTQVFVGSGYFNLWPNISSVVATFLPLEFSPLATVYMSFLVNLFLVIFIIYGKSNFIVSGFDKLIVCLLTLVTSPMVAEVWLNTLTSQVYFSMITILIYFQIENSNNIFKSLSPIILLISGLTSLIPCVFLPFFIYKWYFQKNFANLLNSITLGFATLFQLCIYSFIKINSLELSGNNLRYDITFDKIVSFFYNVIIKTFFGRDLTQLFFYKYFSMINLPILISLLSLLILIILKFNYKKIKEDKILKFLILFFLIQSLFVIYGGKDNQVQGRFALIPGILLLFITYRFFQITEGFKKKIFALLIFFSLTTGFYEYKINNKYKQFLECYNCPIWIDELNKWKQDKNYKIKIWDYPRKYMVLN
tara:strand:- start:2043 stop:3311 length:1269 start_codon:yes stop_codon:yes gene_type:complete